MADNCSKLMKEAIDGAANEFRGIEYSYKLDDVLESLGPKQKFNPEQLKGYLLKQGVSPYEIEASQMFKGFEGDNRALSAVEWHGLSGRQHLSKEAKTGYEKITLDKEGDNEWSNYKVNEWQSAKPELSTNLSREFRGPEIVADKSQLGWNRVHDVAINGKPTTVLNELQSDWMQAERQGAGIFESKSEIKRLSKEEESLRLSLKDKINGIIKDYNRANPGNEVYVTDDLVEKDLISSEEATRYKDLDRRNQQINNAKLIADFPLKPEKFQQLMIVDGLNEAIERGTNSLAIPIDRTNNELFGSEGVTKFYEELNKKILPDIRKKLEKQGLRVKVSMENYGSSELKPNKNGGDLALLKERHIRDNLDISHLSDAELHDALRNVVKDIRKSTFSSRLGRSSWEALENKGVDVEGELFHKLLTGKYLTPYARNLPSFTTDFFSSRSSKNNELSHFLKAHIPGTPANRLHILEIEEIPNKKVKWDVYGLLGALGLSEYAKEGEENASRNIE